MKKSCLSPASYNKCEIFWEGDTDVWWGHICCGIRLVQCNKSC